MSYTIQALRLLRTEFLRAAKKWTAPRACWFHQAYQEPLDMVQHCKQVRTFLDTISQSADAADIIIANENRRHYTVALLDGTPQRNTFFRRLAVQASTTIREDKQFLHCHLEKLAPGFQSDRSLFEKSGSARYMPWIALAAALRLKHRDIRLQVDVRYCVPGGCVPARWQYHEPAGLDGKEYNLPMEAISVYATSDGIFRFPNTYQGPPFSLWGFTHDVWRVSVAAMDKLIEAAEQSAEGIEPTATKEQTADPEAVLPAAAESDAPIAAIPQWNSDRNELSFGGLVVKQYRTSAKNQTAILEAFQVEGWPARVDDPLPFTKEGDPRQRLADAVHALNKNGAILFELDGRKGVIWKPKSL